MMGSGLPSHTITFKSLRELWMQHRGHLGEPDLIIIDEAHYAYPLRPKRGDHRYWMWKGRQLARRDYHPTKEPTCQNSQTSDDTSSNSLQRN